MLGTNFRIITAAVIAVPVGLLLWGFSPYATPDSLSGGKTTYLTFLTGYILMAFTVTANIVILAFLKKLSKSYSNFGAIVATTIQGLVIGLSFDWIKVAEILTKNYTLFVFPFIVVFFNALLFLLIMKILDKFE